MKHNKHMTTLLVKKEIENAQKIIDKKDIIIDTIQKFNGKVFNARFKNALNEATGLSFSTETRYKMRCLEVRFYDDRYVSHIEPSYTFRDITIESQTHGAYIENDNIRIVAFYDHDEIQPTDENNRIISSAYIDALNEWIERTQKENAETLEALEHIEEIESKRNELIQQIEDFNSSLNGNIETYTNQRISVRR